MKKQLFTAFIVFLGVIVIFYFYNSWEAKDVPKKVSTQPYNLDTTYMPESINLERNIDTKISLKKSTTHKPSSLLSVKKELVALDVPYDNPASMEAHTQDVYEVLTPDNYHESIKKADESFKALDSHVNKISQRLNEHTRISSTGTSFREEDLLQTEDTYEMELPDIHE